MSTYNTTDLVKGNNIMLYVGTTPVAFAKTCDLSISSASIDATNKMSGNWKTSIAGQNSFTISSDFFYTSATGNTSFDTLFASQTNGTAVSFTIGIADPATFALTGTGLYTGSAHISSLSMKAEDNAIVSCSVSLEGSGALAKVATV
jgi:predicted secreted protein